MKTENPSIGAIGTMFSDEINFRTKGFFTQVHSSLTEVRATLMKTLSTPRFGTRETYRVLTDRSVSKAELRELQVTHDGRSLHCEAMIPVRNHDTVTHITYYAYNDPERCNNQTTTSQEEMLMCAVMDKDRHHRTHDYKEYTVELSTPTDSQLVEADICALAQIYGQTFTSYLTDLHTLSVWAMVKNNVVAVVRDSEDEVVAVSMAEVAEIPLNSTIPLRIAEISEVSTSPDHQRRGLSHLACMAVMNHLRTMNIHTVFSETRAVHFAMMAVAFDCGLSPRGWLIQHCLIASNFSEVAQPTQFGDLAVFSL